MNWITANRYRHYPLESAIALIADDVTVYSGDDGFLDARLSIPVPTSLAIRIYVSHYDYSTSKLWFSGSTVGSQIASTQLQVPGITGLEMYSDISEAAVLDNGTAIVPVCCEFTSGIVYDETETEVSPSLSYSNTVCGYIVISTTMKDILDAATAVVYFREATLTSDGYEAKSSIPEVRSDCVDESANYKLSNISLANKSHVTDEFMTGEYLGDSPTGWPEFSVLSVQASSLQIPATIPEDATASVARHNNAATAAIIKLTPGVCGESCIDVTSNTWTLYANVARGFTSEAYWAAVFSGLAISDLLSEAMLYYSDKLLYDDILPPEGITHINGISPDGNGDVRISGGNHVSAVIDDGITLSITTDLL